MLRNYLHIAFRNLVRHKGYTLISVTGLAIGLSSCILIFILVEEEFSVDRYLTHADRTYRLTASIEMGGGDVPIAAPGPLGPTLVELLPGVIKQTRVRCQDQAILIRYESMSLTEPGLCFADPSIFDVFGFGLLTQQLA